MRRRDSAMTFDFGLGAIARLGSGLWGFLTERVKGCTAVAVERERNTGTVEAIKALSDGGELVDYDSGRLRVIWRPGAQQQTPVVGMPQVELPAIELPANSPLPPAASGPADGAVTE
jgi:hypothetical protein